MMPFHAPRPMLSGSSLPPPARMMAEIDENTRREMEMVAGKKGKRKI